MLLLILTGIFFRPFICALAFPYLNLVYSLVFLICLGVYLIYKRPVFAKNQALVWPLSLFYLALCLSVIFSQDRSNSLALVYQYLNGLGLLWVAVSLSEKNKLLTIRTLILAGLAVSLLSLYHYFFGFSHVLDYSSANNLTSPFILDYLQRKRAFFPFVTPGALGGYLAMIFFLVLACKNRFWPAGLIFTALLLTKSLGAFLSLLCALVVYLGVQGKLKKNHFRILAGLLLLLIIMIVWRSSTQKEHLQPVFSALMRINYWQESLAIIKGHPFVGIGLGNFNLPNSRYAHNAYLQIWAEMGILGLASFLWMIAVIFRNCLKKLAQLPDKKQIAGLLAASSVFLIHNLFDFTFFLPEIALVWWVILGLASL
ncbi:MAG TPA: O-antigen ligase family protein [Candidatus Omnitrophota bacterium]|nr:O-antigen ligase family protein [Candidatus Omnitrophota bacterium]